MLKQALAAALLFISTDTIVAAQPPECVTEQQVIDVMAEHGWAEYRRAERVVDPTGSYDLAVAFLGPDGVGEGVWFTGGCFVDEGPATKNGADNYFELYSGKKS